MARAIPRAAACAVSLISLLAAPARAQLISPVDSAEAARFTLVTRAVAKAGFANPLMVGHGQAAYDPLFVLLATSGDHAVLLLVAQPDGAGPGESLELERGESAERLGISGLQFSQFLGQRDLLDIEVSHHPFQLESTHTFATHHIVRRRGIALTHACDFDGADASSYSKGIGSTSSVRRVTVSPVAGAALLTFDVNAVEETIQQRGRDATSVTTAHRESSKRYRFGPTGSCKEIGPP